MQEKPTGKNKYRRRFLIKAAIITVTIYLLLSQVICIRRNGSNAMFPSICEGDLVVAFRLANPAVGDAIIYKDVDGREKLGRVTASAGMRVEIDEDGYRINGMTPSENIYYPTTPAEEGIDFPVIVPERSFFVLNDFRMQMDDSRTQGCIQKDDVLGEIIFIMRRREI